jgi:hypothetical protein
MSGEIIAPLEREHLVASAKSARRPARPMYHEHFGGSGTSLLQSERLVVRHTFSDGVERTDEYEKGTSNLVARRWRSKSAIGGEAQWEYEFGEPEAVASVDALGRPRECVAVAEAAGTPLLVRRNAPDAWEFRIRNLFFPIETYELSVEDATQSIVLRTKNKKYFKKFDIPAMWRASLALDDAALSMQHNLSTLLIRYRKPAEIVAAELSERDHVIEAAKSAKEGDVGCKTQ